MGRSSPEMTRGSPSTQRTEPVNKGSGFSSSRHIQVGMHAGARDGLQTQPTLLAQLPIPFGAEKQVRGSMGKAGYTWREVFVFKAHNRNVDTPDSIHHLTNICTVGLNPESWMC